MKYTLLVALTLCSNILTSSAAHAQAADDSFLETGWIVWNLNDPLGNTYFSTYDFASYEAGGVETAEVRRWYNAGTLGWTFNGTYPYVYQTDGTNIFLQSASGASEVHTILEYTGHYMRTQSSTGEQLWMSCAGASIYGYWIELAYLSTRSCTGL